MTTKLKEVWHRLPMPEQVCLWVPEAVLRSLLSEAGFSGFLQLTKLLLTSKKQLFFNSGMLRAENWQYCFSKRFLSRKLGHNCLQTLQNEVYSTPDLEK